MALQIWIFLITLTLYGGVFGAPEVKSPAGSFQGKILTSFSGVDYASYRGIPYSLPPTGGRRFGLPVPHPKLEEVHDAGEFGPICPQHWRGSKLGQEDCLYLNVFTPLDRAEAKVEDGLRKVLVFIHGGGFVVGSANPYVPGDLVTRGDLVVVTFNYRLGWLGLLRGNSTLLPGNVAFWDQVLALKWVKDNIRYFGGDPDDVTLSGESAGSMSVSLLSLSPAAKGLFTKAILLSGAAPIFQDYHRTSNDILQIAANKFGCSVESISGNEDELVRCLLQLPAEDFLATFDCPLLIGGISFGDEFLPRPLSTAIKDVNYLSDIGFLARDYLVSITDDDGNIMVNAIFGKMDTSSIDSSVPGISMWLGLPDDLVKLILTEYEKIFGDIDKAATAVITDSFFLKQSFVFLDTFRSGKSMSESQAYFMAFTHIPKYIPNRYVLHALDLCYLFDLTPKDLVEAFYHVVVEGGFNEEDLEMKQVYTDLVADFLTTGYPGERLSKEKGVTWPVYDTEKKTYLSLSLQPSVKEDYLGNRRVIWDKLVPQWLAENKNAEKKQEL